jgi:hypothetical protein
VSSKVAHLRRPFPIGKELIVDRSEFDRLVDEGYEDMLIITPDSRYVVSIDDWLDYGYDAVHGGREVRMLHRSFLGRA